MADWNRRSILPWRRDRILTVGQPKRDMLVREGLTPQQNYRRERIRYAWQQPLLHLVPRPLRHYGPLRRYFWQLGEVITITAKAHAIQARIDRKASDG